MPSFCRSCKAEIVWAKMRGSGRANPLDADPSPKGNVRLNSDGSGSTLTLDEADAARGEGEQLHISHWATCPDKEDWRRKTAGGNRR